MGTEGDVCYFSSTGDSLVIARELSEALSCRLIPVCADTDLGIEAPFRSANRGGGAHGDS